MNLLAPRMEAFICFIMKKSFDLQFSKAVIIFILQFSSLKINTSIL